MIKVVVNETAWLTWHSTSTLTVVVGNTTVTVDNVTTNELRELAHDLDQAALHVVAAMDERVDAARAASLQGIRQGGD